MFIYCIILLQSWTVDGHVRFTFPQSRTPVLDFLNTADSQLPCGFPPTNGTSTVLIAGTRFRSTFHLAHPQTGGVKIELAEEEPFRVVIDLTKGFLLKQNSTIQFLDISLPPKYACDKCLLRLLMQAAGGEFMFVSCADVTILPFQNSSLPECKKVGKIDYDECDMYKEGLSLGQTEEELGENPCPPETTSVSSTTTTSADATITSSTGGSSSTLKPSTSSSAPSTSAPTTATKANRSCIASPAQAYSHCFSGKCLHGGVCNKTSGNCSCLRLFSGDRCEHRDECWSDEDCENGRCIDTRSATHPRLVCYCEAGWFGVHCNIKSSVKLQKNYTAHPDYQTHVIRSGLYTIHWRLLEEDIEIVVEARTLSWVGVGWRPLDISSSCKEFPSSEEVEMINDRYSDEGRDNTPSNMIPPYLDTVTEGEGSSPNTAPCIASNSSGNEWTEPDLSVMEERNFVAMDCADIVIGSVNKDSLYRVEDMYTRDRSTPQPDEFYLGSDSITGAAGSQVDGTTTIVFRKKREATGVSDHTIGDVAMTVIWALGQDTFGDDEEECLDEKKNFYQTDVLKYHGPSHDRRGAIAINFNEESNPIKDGSACPTESNEFMVPHHCHYDVTSIDCLSYLSWKLDNQTEQIEFVFQYPFKQGQWNAVGFSSTPDMRNSDVIVSWTSPLGVTTLQDRWADGYEIPTIDSSYDLSNLSSDVTSDIVTVTFHRPRDTGDPHDVTFNGTTCYYVILTAGLLSTKGELLKHSQTPIVGKEQVCIKSCANTEVSYSFAIELVGERFTPNLLIPRSKQYQALKSQVETSLRQAYNLVKPDGVIRVDVEVVGFEPGSIIVNYIITAVYDPSLSRTLHDSMKVNLTEELEKFLKDNSLHLPGTSFFVDVIKTKGINETEDENVNEDAKVSSMVYLVAILIGLVVLVKVAKTGIQERRKRYEELRQQSKKLQLSNEPTFNDVSVNMIYEELFKVLQQRNSSILRSGSYSSAADIRKAEQSHSNVQEFEHRLKQESSKKGSDGRVDSEFWGSVHPPQFQRPSSAKVFPRKPSMEARKRPKSAKAFESKTKYDNSI